MGHKTVAAFSMHESSAETREQWSKRIRRILLDCRSDCRYTCNFGILHGATPRDPVRPYQNVRGGSCMSRSSRSSQSDQTFVLLSFLLIIFLHCHHSGAERQAAGNAGSKRLPDPCRGCKRGHCIPGPNTSRTRTPCACYCRWDAGPSRTPIICCGEAGKLTTRSAFHPRPG